MECPEDALDFSDSGDPVRSRRNNLHEVVRWIHKTPPVHPHVGLLRHLLFTAATDTEEN